MDAAVELTGPYPGVVGDVVGWHGSYYAEHHGHDMSFEAEVANEMGEFMLRYDPDRDAFLVARQKHRYAGSVVLDAGNPVGVRLRWFFVPPGLRGKGVGGLLIDRFFELAEERGVGHVHLWTYRGLEAARALYLRAGFELTEENPCVRWGCERVMQKYEWRA